MLSDKFAVLRFVIRRGEGVHIHENDEGRKSNFNENNNGSVTSLAVGRPAFTNAAQKEQTFVDNDDDKVTHLGRSAGWKALARP